MQKLYNLLYSVWLWLRAPLGLLQLGREGERRAVFSQRFGRFRAKTKQALTNRQMLWLHGSSREALTLCTRLVHALESHAALYKIVVSTDSSRGMDRLRRLLPTQVERIFVPFDLRRPVQRSLSVIHPEAMVFLEPVLRPNLLWRLKQRRIPTLLVTGRLSPVFYLRCRRWRLLTRPLFAGLAAVAVPDDETAGQMRELGCRAEGVHVVGAWPEGALTLGEQRPVSVSDLFKRIGAGSDPILLLGSATEAGEEAMLTEVYLRVRARHPRLFLGLVPDRYQRGKEVGRVLKQLGVRYVYRTAVTAATRMATGSVDCLVINTRGESAAFESGAAVVYVGRALTVRGREDALAGVAASSPVIFGPGTIDEGTLADVLVKCGGGRQVGSAMELDSLLKGLLEDPALGQGMRSKASAAVEVHCGAVARVADLILSHARGDEGSA